MDKALRAAMQAYRESGADPQPPPKDGYLTILQWADKWGYSREWVRVRILALLRTGGAKRRMQVSRNTIGRITHYAVYKILTKDKHGTGHISGRGDGR